MLPLKQYLSKLLRLLPLREREMLIFRLKCGYWPNLHTPRTFNEKVMWRKLYDRNEVFTVLADKLRVREFVRERVGEKYLTDLYGVYDDPRTIDFDSLPRRYVLKATHDCGSAILVTDGQNVDQARVVEKLSRALRRVYGRDKGEWWYANIPPRILAEEFLNDASFGGSKVPPDFKFFVFQGLVAMIQVDVDRYTDHRRTLYDRQWRKIEATYTYPLGPDISRPVNLDEMIWVAETLGRDLDFVRVDLYSIGTKRVVFGEMTFAPESGRGPFYPRELDYWLGDQWTIRSS